MSNALDRFEDSLVGASHALYEAGGSRVRTTPRPVSATGSSVAAWPLHAMRGPRRRSLRALAGVLAIGALAAAGSTVFGPRGNPRTTQAIECGRVIVGSVTGDPVRDCTTLWSSIYHRPAPSLVAWVASTGGAVVVVPAGAPPADDRSFHWRQLPAGWTQDRAAIQMSNQLEDVAYGLQAHPCWTPAAAATLVALTSRASGLLSWKVDVKDEPDEGAKPSCLLVTPVVQAGSNSVLLVERHVDPPRDGSFMTPSAARELARAAAVEKRVDGELSSAGTRCAGIREAAALWSAQAHAAGIPGSRYVLLTQSPGLAPTGCARITVNAPGGGGPYRVYVAEPM
jgi:hypothetical protein